MVDKITFTLSTPRSYIGAIFLFEDEDGNDNDNGDGSGGDTDGEPGDGSGGDTGDDSDGDSSNPDPCDSVTLSIDESVFASPDGISMSDSPDWTFVPGHCTCTRGIKEKTIRDWSSKYTIDELKNFAIENDYQSIVLNSRNGNAYIKKYDFVFKPE